MNDRDWIDDFASIATVEQLKSQLKELKRFKKDVENYNSKVEKLKNILNLNL